MTSVLYLLSGTWFTLVLRTVLSALVLSPITAPPARHRNIGANGNTATSRTETRESATLRPRLTHRATARTGTTRANAGARNARNTSTGRPLLPTRRTATSWSNLDRSWATDVMCLFIFAPTHPSTSGPLSRLFSQYISILFLSPAFFPICQPVPPSSDHSHPPITEQFNFRADEVLSLLGEGTFGRVLEVKECHRCAFVHLRSLHFDAFCCIH